MFYAQGMNYYKVDNNNLNTRYAEVDVINKIKKI